MARLSSQQRKKSVDVWNNGLNEVQRTVIIASIHSVLEHEAAVHHGARAVNTNLHDRARVRHLFFDPLLIENPPQHYGQLAACCFNNYERYHYLNPTFHPETNEALAGMDVAFDSLKDINPCMGPDIRPLRGGFWIKNELITFI